MSREAKDAAKRAYDEAVEQASKVWAAAMSQAMDKGRQAALRAYDEAIAQGLDEAKALEKSIVVAVKTHQEAVAPAQKAYDEACEQALAAFMRFNLMSRQARDAAKKAYDEAVEQASKVWAAAMSQALDKGRDAGLKAHQEAMASPQKAYDEACAQAFAAFARATAQ